MVAGETLLLLQNLWESSLGLLTGAYGKVCVFGLGCRVKVWSGVGPYKIPVWIHHSASTSKLMAALEMIDCTCCLVTLFDAGDNEYFGTAGVKPYDCFT